MQKRYFDLHTDTASVMFDRKCSFAENDLHVDLKRMEGDFEYVQFMTLFSDCSHTDMTGRYETLLANRDRETAGKCAVVATRAEYEAAKKAGLHPILHAIEGGEMLFCSPDRIVKAAREDKLLMAGVAWNNPNTLYTRDGLTAEGCAYVAACNQEGVVLDISHLNDVCAAEVLSRGDRVIASHSNARTLCDVPRDLPDELIRAIGRKKGLIGLNFYTEFISKEPSQQTFLSLARHAAYIADMVGVSVVALGSDLDGCILPPGATGMENLPDMASALSEVGFSAAEIDDICFANAFNYFLK